MSDATMGLAASKTSSAARNSDTFAPDLVSRRAATASAGPATAGSGSSRSPRARITREALQLPYAAAGLDRHQAAAHLLDRLAYGARPGEVERIAGMGPEAWLAEQLGPVRADEDLERRLEPFPSLRQSTREIVEGHPRPGQVLREAVAAGELSQEDAEKLQAREGGSGSARRQLIAFARERGYRSQRRLLGELGSQKLLRAVYARNQLHEVLTDFWINHFAVSSLDPDCRNFVLGYERDAIRPAILGSFRGLLGNTARHPAMLLYLDNARSVADEGVRTTFDPSRSAGRGGRAGQRRGGGNRRGQFGSGRGSRRRDDEDARRRPPRERPSGLNENYARELLELHTLGVDGGYQQADVVAVARAFTGWTLLPPGFDRQRIESRLSRLRRLPNQGGFVLDGDFLFRADQHDAESKVVLGTRLPAGRGIEDGTAVLDLLAAHPSTAQHVCRKLAVRFVADEPPQSLVQRMAQAWQRSGGELQQVMRVLVQSPEFWASEARAAKIRTPLELVAASLRGLDAELRDSRQLFDWLRRLGQPLYSPSAPTGFPDEAEHWVSTGSLIARMSFAMELAQGRVSGVTVDLEPLLAAAGIREPESLEAALVLLADSLLPGRDRDQALEPLRPMLHHTSLPEELQRRSREQDADSVAGRRGNRSSMAGDGGESLAALYDPEAEDLAPEMASTAFDSDQLSHVAGVILGSPEFQRR